MTDGYISGKNVELILISGLDAASLGFGVALTTLQGGNIDNNEIHTRENNVIGEGVYRPPPRVEVIPPRVEVIGRGIYRRRQTR